MGNIISQEVIAQEDATDNKTSSGASQSDILEQKTIQEVLDNELVIPHFQAITDISSKKILGFESLARLPADIALEGGETLFALAERTDNIEHLDRICIKNTIRAAKAKELPGLLFINILPETLLDIEDILPLDDSSSLSGIVFEISERHPLDNIERLSEKILLLKKHGAKIAIDDLGTGYSGLKVWSEMRPNYVKIDYHFIKGIHEDPVKREFVRSIVEISRGLQCHVVAEGIEQPQELEALYLMGIQFTQGFLLHRPESHPNSDNIDLPDFLGRSINAQSVYRSASQTIEVILYKTITVEPDARADDVNDIFKHHPNLHSVPVIENKKPAGIISRTRILDIFSGRYSHQLYGYKSIRGFMDNSPIVVDINTSLEEVSRQVTAKSTDLNADIIITRNEIYEGVGSVSTLLGKITETQIHYARYSNPLTLLPGSVPLHETMDNFLDNKIDFHLAYCDIDNFKPYNDYYGYSRGDEVISRLSEILLSCTSPDMDIVGHVGGDDFVIIFRSHDWKERALKILTLFEGAMTDFYSNHELKEEGIWSKSRQGQLTFFNLMSLSIGIVHPSSDSCHSHHEVSALASQAKGQAKLTEGNHLFICRRQCP